MKPIIPITRRPDSRGFTLVEVLISLSIITMVLTMCMSTFLLGLRAMYKDNQRLETNATLRTLMAQVTKETLDASFFYLFPYYSDIDADVSLVSGAAGGPSSMVQIEDAADNDYDKWISHGDCLVLVTTTSRFRTTDIRQIRVYYRMVTTQTARNGQAELRYFESQDWGEGSSSTSNGHPLSTLAGELNAINLAANPSPTGHKVLAKKTIGRIVPAASTPFVAGDRYPVFSSESPDSTATNGFIAINMEVVNGTTQNNLLSSSSFNYTVSPRR